MLINSPAEFIKLNEELKQINQKKISIIRLFLKIIHKGQK